MIDGYSLIVGMILGSWASFTIYIFMIGKKEIYKDDYEEKED